MKAPIAIVPSFCRTDKDLELLGACLRTMKETADLDVLVVDDASPLGTETERVADEHEAEFHCQDENGGFSKAVNVGLARALGEERDALLVNSDVEFIDESDWLSALVGTDADVVGALLLYPTGGHPIKLVQSAGSYYSALTRGWFHRFQYAPVDVEEVWIEKECPCTAALQLVRWKCLEEVGLYDEEYELAFEDVDYALRVFAAGRTCRYQPYAMAFHHESTTRGDGSFSDKEVRSLIRLSEQHPASECLRFAGPPW